MPPTFFSKNVDLKLIQLVKDNPVLYNPRHPKYTDSDTREVTWQKIGDVLSRPAAEFAGIQCQIHYGDFQEDKHKPGFIENMKEFMPEQYAGSWGVEKKVLKEYRRHQGLSQLEAKNLYIKTARALPTYGVTFFLVKEKQKDKKKLIPRLLGISAEAVLRLDERTKEVLQEWPLTHVKTYHAAKGEIFTLDFGDYSKEQYSVKTRDAYRIRDILEDYIDLIRKRMLAPGGGCSADAAYVTHDNVSCSQANIIQLVSNNPSKVIEQTFVGPSKIITHEVGTSSSQGTQIITVQQIVVSEKGHHHQQGVKGEVGMRGDMSLPFTRRLNRLNSNSVKIVSLLTVPSQTHFEDARKIVEAMNGDLSYVRDGVKETIDKQTNEEEKQKLREQMRELDELMALLNQHTAPGNTDASEIGDAAMKVADVTTQMYFALDAGSKRRSRIISRSRPSFVEDDRTRQSVRRASFVAAASTAAHAVDGSRALLNEEYDGPALDAQRCAELEAASVDKLGKLNAAVAHYLLAHTDPKNVDYEAAVVSMNTIHELMPDFCRDAQALASREGPGAKSQVLLDAAALCDCIKRICSSTGAEDREKQQEAAKHYAEASGRLVFTFGKGANAEKENEMLDLADDVASKTSLALMSAQQLAEGAGAEHHDAIDAAGVAAAEAAKDVLMQVKLCAPTISEPHCQSAVAAAGAALAARAQALASAAHTPAAELHRQLLDLAAALDRLKGAYSSLPDEEGEVFENEGMAQERRRLKFVNTVTASGRRWAELDHLLQEESPALEAEEVGEVGEAGERLEKRLGQLNAAIAALLAATADRDRPDYATAELAINTIHELMPQVVQDTKVASADRDADARAAMMQHIKALCEASKGICATDYTSPEERTAAIAKFTNASGKLVFGISHRGNPDKESQILKIADEVVQRSEQLAGSAEQLEGGEGGERGAGRALRAAARGLRETAQLTARSMSEPRCQNALLSSAEGVSSSSRALTGLCSRRGGGDHLERQRGQLEESLNRLREACVEDQKTVEPPRAQQKLQFIKTMTAAQHQIDKAQEALDKPIPPALPAEQAEEVQGQLSGKLSALGAALARLLAALAGPGPDYNAAEDATQTIGELLPLLVKDTQSTCANKDEATRAAMLDLLREMCEASRGLCARAEGGDTNNFDEAASKFSNAAGKMVYMVNPRADANRENQIMGLAASACSKASQLLSGVQGLAGGAGGARGELDQRGAAVADAARGLMATAQITAPSISSPQCKQALLRSVSQLSSSGQQLARCWGPLLQQPQHKKQLEALQGLLTHMDEHLDKLKKICDMPDEDLQKPTLSISPEERKLQFGVTLSGAKEHISKAQKALDKPLPPPLAADKANAVQLRLSGRLGELNAAIAALLTATADKERPDYKMAEHAVRTITDLMPHVVQDTQSTCANKDEATRAAMLDLLRELCEASRGVCAGADGHSAQGLGDAVSKFSDASGKLVYVVSPHVNADREKLIDDLSTEVGREAFPLSAGVREVAGAAGAARGEELRSRGAAVADAAQNLLTTSQLTSSSISSPQCKQALLRSVSQLSSSGQQLARCWGPLLQQPQHKKQLEALQGLLAHMDEHLDKLKKACNMPDSEPKSAELPAELQKLQFVKTMSGARDTIHRAQDTLDQPIPPPLPSDEAEVVQLRLSGRLGQLNAAIAALLAATADRNNPDYKTAEKSMKTLSELIPLVVQDTQSSCSVKEEATRAAMLDLLRELCEAGRGVCSADGHNAQGVTEAAEMLSNASGKLVYIVSPRANADRERMVQYDDMIEGTIMSLSAGACERASQLLAQVSALPPTVEGASARELGARGAAVEASARLLEQTAKLTASSISESGCQHAMQASIRQLSSCSSSLVGAWRPLLQGHSWSTLKRPLQDLEIQLEELSAACKIPDTDIEFGKDGTSEHARLRLLAALSSAAEQVERCRRALDKPPPPSGRALDPRRAVAKLGELNAAIADLVLATSDRERPDYKMAEQAALTIAETMPHVVQDTQSTCANKDEATRAAMLDLLRELCEASRGVCAGADNHNAQMVDGAVSKFSAASSKLLHAVNPHASENKDKQIIGLCAEAYREASQLSAGAGALAGAAGAARGEGLTARGAALADAAQDLLTSSKITASSISSHQCKQALLRSVSVLSSSGQQLARCWGPLLQQPQHRKQLEALQGLLTHMDDHLEKIKKICHGPDEDVKTKEVLEAQQKEQFTRAMEQAKEQIKIAEKGLDKPIPPPVSSDKAEVVHHRLAGRLGDLNAAIASLLSATADQEKPYYETAEKAVKAIVDLLPHVIEDTLSACANKEPASRAAALTQARRLAAAAADVCARADGTHAQGLSEAVGKFSSASSKLGHAVDPQDDADKDRVVELAAAACSRTSQLLTGVQQAALAAGARARELDRRGAALADAAQALLAVAQVTAPSIGQPSCRRALEHPLQLLDRCSRQLSASWQPLPQARALDEHQQLLQGHIEELKAFGQGPPKKRQPPPAPRRLSSVPTIPPGAPAAPGALGPYKHTKNVSKEFLDRLRLEEDQNCTKARGALERVMTDDDKRLQKLFLRAAEDAERTLGNTEEGLKQMSQSGASALSVGECRARQAALQRNIALASVHVARLVGANYGQTMDYAAATKATKELPEIMSTIVEDGKVVSGGVGAEAGRDLRGALREACAAARGLCRAAPVREKLNDAAIEFGDKSAKLLYIVSNDVDPALEKEIISRAKAIGDGVVQISVRAGDLASPPPAAPAGPGGAPLEALCEAGARCQDGAGRLLYTAKLVAPSISEPPCQEALYRSAEQLSTELASFTSSWKPFSADPRHAKTVKELIMDADNLDRILEGLKSDVKGGKLSQRREIERLVVEDTPIRQLTLKIMEDAKKLSESSDLSPALKKEYIEYSKKLSDALRSSDLANARCKRTPHDTNKRRELENAIQNLQIILLQTRPTRGDKPRSNIVDLRDFIDEVSSEADKLVEVTSSVSVPTAADKKIIQSIAASSENISKAAYKLTHTDAAAGFDTSFDDILDVDQFGQECDTVIKDINSQLKSIEDAKTRSALLAQVLPLTESCNMLRFATKSGISSTKSASIEATLDDLDDLESSTIAAIVNSADNTVTLRGARPPPGAAARALAVAVCSPRSPRAALCAYTAHCAATTDPDNKNKLLQHVFQLAHLLRTRAGQLSRRLAVWQPEDDAEVTSITEQILKEIQNPESKFQESAKTKKILNDGELNKLLIPNAGKIIGDTRHQEGKLNELCTKLSSMSGALALNIASPEALARAAHAAAEAAVELAAIARGCKNKKEPVNSERIEEAVQEMTFTTYGVLKTAEQACLEQENSNSKRLLLDACRKLNECINKLVSVSSSSSALHQECGSISRGLQLQEACLQGAPGPTSGMPYQQCCEALNLHQETVYKLKSDQPMTRQEFARSLTEVNDAVCKTTEISSQCAYLISMSEKDSDIAKKGPVNVLQIQKSIESLQDSCIAIIGSTSIHQAKEETEDLQKLVQDFSRALDEAQLKAKDGGVKATLTRAKSGVTTSAATLCESLKEETNMEKTSGLSAQLLSEVSRAHALLTRGALTPAPAHVSAPARARCHELATHSKNLLSRTKALVEEVASAGDDELMTWVTFSAGRTKLLDAYDALLKSIRVNGQRAGILEGTPEDDAEDLDAEHKTYLEIQVDLATKWLSKPMCKSDVKKTGQDAARNVIDIADKMSSDLKGSEREEIRHLVTECEQLVAHCTAAYDHEKYSTLIERLKELKKAVQRSVVTQVVEDFMEVDDPAADLLIDAEEDEQKRKSLLERKIAELLALLARTARTARCAARLSPPAPAETLLQASKQTELLAPVLVQAAQERIATPNDQAVIARYKELLAQYAASVAKVRDLCDRAVDPMDFVQTAGDTMQRMREESANDDVQKGHKTSEAIIKLANRSIEVSMSSLSVRRDPELRAALQQAAARVRQAAHSHARASRLPDWRERANEVMRTTGELESSLAGENIFKKQPSAQGTHQQIYTSALELHESVRGWSARDNDIVAAARRVAVLLARLAGHVQTENKQALISTSKSIVSQAHEVAALARKLAHECTDVRIKTNLLQTCERIPTISAQLKMLTTVKGSSLGHQGSKEDTEAMDMLVGNAQSLMLSIQEVVKVAAGASVKIMSQRGTRLRWVRKNYY